MDPPAFKYNITLLVGHVEGRALKGKTLHAPALYGLMAHMLHPFEIIGS